MPTGMQTQQLAVRLCCL